MPDCAGFLATPGTDVAARAHSGTTPLHAACEAGQLGAVTALLQLDPGLANHQNEAGQVGAKVSSHFMLCRVHAAPLRS